jgi:hypothetical protein
VERGMCVGGRSWKTAIKELNLEVIRSKFVLSFIKMVPLKSSEVLLRLMNEKLA